MSELVTKSVAQEQPGQKIETRTAAQRVAGFTVVVTAVAVLAVLVATAVYAQDKYSLKSPSGIAFSDFKGYEDWAVVSSARADEVLKVIVGNPTMITAYKAGVPGKPYSASGTEPRQMITSGSTPKLSARPATAKPVDAGGCACTTAFTSGRSR